MPGGYGLYIGVLETSWEEAAPGIPSTAPKPASPVKQPFDKAFESLRLCIAFLPWLACCVIGAPAATGSRYPPPSPLQGLNLPNNRGIPGAQLRKGFVLYARWATKHLSSRDSVATGNLPRYPV